MAKGIPKEAKKPSKVEKYLATKKNKNDDKKQLKLTLRGEDKSTSSVEKVSLSPGPLKQLQTLLPDDVKLPSLVWLKSNSARLLDGTPIPFLLLSCCSDIIEPIEEGDYPYIIKMKDASGEMDAAFHPGFMSLYGSLIKIGTALAVQNCRLQLYSGSPIITITKDNVAYIAVRLDEVDARGIFPNSTLRSTLDGRIDMMITKISWNADTIRGKCLSFFAQFTNEKVVADLEASPSASVHPIPAQASTADFGDDEGDQELLELVEKMEGGGNQNITCNSVFSQDDEEFEELTKGMKY